MHQHDGSGGCGCGSGGSAGGGSCGSGSGHGHGHGPSAEQRLEEALLRSRMDQVKHKILVLSGKGGVGKSTVAVNLALALAAKGKKVGLLDVDVHGPTVPLMIGLQGAHPEATGHETLLPLERHGVKVMSVGFLLPDENAPVIWRGPLKMGIIQQFLRDVEWGELDFLVVDAPPGTGDEPLSVGQFLPEAVALVVTTPQKVSTADVRKSIQFCHQLNIPILGVVENMNGMICPHCQGEISLFPEGEGKRMAEEAGLKLLSSLPLDPRISHLADQGASVVADPTTIIGKAMAPVVDEVLKLGLV